MILLQSNQPFEEIGAEKFYHKTFAFLLKTPGMVPLVDISRLCAGADLLLVSAAISEYEGHTSRWLDHLGLFVIGELAIAREVDSEEVKDIIALGAEGFYQQIQKWEKLFGLTEKQIVFYNRVDWTICGVNKPKDIFPTYDDLHFTGLFLRRRASVIVRPHCAGEREIPDMLLDVTEAAFLAGTTTDTILKASCDGKLPRWSKGGGIREIYFDVKDIRRLFLEKQDDKLDRAGLD
jgi:hypothetical protein